MATFPRITKEGDVAISTEESLRGDAERVFPHWNEAQREKWVRAKLYAQRCTPRFARLPPMTMEQLARPTQPFAPRTLKEAVL